MSRRKDEIARVDGYVLCPRCGKEPETPQHRIWLCECNSGKPAFDDSAELVPQALAQMDMDEGFWLRGMMPAPWTAVPPSPSQEA